MKSKEIEVDLGNVYAFLEKLCEKNGTNLTQLCRKAKVNRSIVERWKNSNPKSIDTLNKLVTVINEDVKN